MVPYLKKLGMRRSFQNFEMRGNSATAGEQQSRLLSKAEAVLQYISGYLSRIVWSRTQVIGEAIDLLQAHVIS